MRRILTFGGIVLAVITLVVPVLFASDCEGGRDLEEVLDDPSTVGFVEREHIAYRPQLGLFAHESVSVPIVTWGHAPEQPRLDHRRIGFCTADYPRPAGSIYPAAVTTEGEDSWINIERVEPGGHITPEARALIEDRFDRATESRLGFSDRGSALVILYWRVLAVLVLGLGIAWVVYDRSRPPERSRNPWLLAAAAAIAVAVGIAFGALPILLLGLSAAAFASWSGRAARTFVVVIAVLGMPLPGVEPSWLSAPLDFHGYQWQTTVAWFAILALALAWTRSWGRSSTVLAIFGGGITMIKLAVWSLGREGIEGAGLVGVLIAIAGLAVALAAARGRLPTVIRRGKRLLARLRARPFEVAAALAVPVAMTALAAPSHHDIVIPLLLGMAAVAVLAVVERYLPLIMLVPLIGVAIDKALDGDILQRSWDPSEDRMILGFAIVGIAVAALLAARGTLARVYAVVGAVGAAYTMSGLLYVTSEDAWAKPLTSTGATSLMAGIGAGLVLWFVAVRLRSADDDNPEEIELSGFEEVRTDRGKGDNGEG